MSSNVGLLYPDDNAPLLSELPPADRPSQLVIPDGTWHHVKTLMRDVPRLPTLPRFRLTPASPGRYRIRREPHVHALSTLEATVAALEALEPETAGLDHLTGVFDRMIGDQLNRSSKSNWRQNHHRRPGSPNVPRVLTGDLSNVVVAYGERERGNQHGGVETTRPSPVYWTAVRLISGETFQCAIDSDSLRDERFLNHVRLPRQVIDDSVTLNEFRESWRAFLREGDRLAIYHNKTAELLENVDAKFSPVVILKSINVQREETADAKAASGDVSRAAQRLENAVDFVNLLNRRYGMAATPSGASD